VSAAHIMMHFTLIHHIIHKWVAICRGVPGVHSANHFLLPHYAQLNGTTQKRFMQQYPCVFYDMVLLLEMRGDGVNGKQ
jgi:hypothetical protein